MQESPTAEAVVVMGVKNSMRTKQELGLADLLLYQTLISEDVIEMKNGALLAGFWYEGRIWKAPQRRGGGPFRLHQPCPYPSGGAAWMLR